MSATSANAPTVAVSVVIGIVAALAAVVLLVVRHVRQTWGRRT
ncbi:hypothetical protein AB0I34_02035 [Kribbella sp. NPDC050281]